MFNSKKYINDKYLNHSNVHELINNKSSYIKEYLLETPITIRDLCKKMYDEFEIEVSFDYFSSLIKKNFSNEYLFARNKYYYFKNYDSIKKVYEETLNVKEQYSKLKEVGGLKKNGRNQDKILSYSDYAIMTKKFYSLINKDIKIKELDFGDEDTAK